MSSGAAAQLADASTHQATADARQIVREIFITSPFPRF
jgi:hypothetical protein